MEKEYLLYYINKKYKIKKIGRIAKAYTDYEERFIYSAVAKLLSFKYSNIVSEKELYELLSQKGSIYSLDFFSNENVGICDRKTCDIAINILIKDLSPTLLHELLHKIGFVKNNESFMRMNNNYLEAGTELITSNTLKTKDCYIELYNSILVKTSDVQTSYYLLVALVNQLNIILGNNLLEKSILTGNNNFELGIRQKYGPNIERYLKSEVDKIMLLEDRYLKNKNVDKNKLLSKISNLQDYFLNLEFKNKLRDINNELDAQVFLENLIEFSYERIRFYDEYRDLKDDYFEKFFCSCKEELEEKFNVKFNLFFKRIDWLNRYSQKPKVSPPISIKNLADKFERKHRKKGLLKIIFDEMKKNKSDVKEDIIPVMATESNIFNSDFFLNSDYSKNINSNNMSDDCQKKDKKEQCKINICYEKNET